MNKFHIFVAILATISLCEAEESRLKKAFSVFNIVKFKNDACAGSDMKNGTCYTEAECSDRGGKSSGSCAEGYGVCCIFTLGCSEKASENCTYFESSGMSTGACNAQICRNNPNICQIRLDFDSFEIAGPSTSTLSVSKILLGVANDMGALVGTKGQCLDDQFAISVPGGQSTNVICGKNTGEHLYVEATEECATMSFQLSDAATVTRKWAIKILQYSCEYENLAPKGCLQYFYGTKGEGAIKSFNFDGGVHLANQNQNICIRKESGMCRICYAHAATEFDVSFGETGTADMGHAGTTMKECCGYGTDGKKETGYDCVIIPRASKQATADKLVGGSEFCGRALADASMGAAGGPATVCSKVVPFGIRFLSDTFEFDDGAAGKEAKNDAKGFKLSYKQESC